MGRPARGPGTCLWACRPARCTHGSCLCGHSGFLFWEGSRARSPFGTPSWLKATQRPRACHRGSPILRGSLLSPTPLGLWPFLPLGGQVGGEGWTPGPCPLRPAPPHGPSLETEARTEGHGGLSSFLLSPESPLPSAARPKLSGGGRQDPEPPEGRDRGRTGQAGGPRSAASVVRAWAQQPDLGLAIGDGWAARHPQRLCPSGTEGPAHPAAPRCGDCWFRGPGTGREAGESGLQPGKAVGIPGTSCSGPTGLFRPQSHASGRGVPGRGPSRGPRSGPCAGPHSAWLAPVGGGRLLCWKAGPLVPGTLPRGQAPRESRPRPPGTPGISWGAAPTPGDRMPEPRGDKREGRQA